jgi:hypothetical protein
VRSIAAVAIARVPFWWPIVAHVFGIEDDHGPIVQDRPMLFMPNGDDSMSRPTLLILHDHETEIVRKNAQPDLHRKPICP